MKTPLLIALTLSAVPFAAAAAVEPGASLDEVKAVLGPPNGQVHLAERHLVYYERGAIELINGRVTRVDLRSPEEHAGVLAREERQRGERAARRAQLATEGTALRDAKLADAAFQSAPAAYQVAFWEDFARRYPGVPCVEPLAIARVKFIEQMEEKRWRQEEADRLARIEERLAAAEREANAYQVRSYPSYYGRRARHQEFALGPVTYTYYDAPLPVYTTPTTPLINPFQGDPAQPGRRDYIHGRSRRDPCEQGDRGGHPGWRGADRSGHFRRDRM